MSCLSYCRHHFPPAIFQQAVWLYFRFALSYRDVEDLRAERGIDVTCETVRRWVLMFGRAYAVRIRRLRPRPSDRWHLDEAFVRIGGTIHYLWRAVDDEGEVLEIIVQPRRDRKAALTLLRRLLKRQGYTPMPSSPIDFVPTLPPCAPSASLIATPPAGDRTIGQRFPTSRRAKGSNSASVSDRQAGSAVPRNARGHLQPLQYPAPPDLSPNASNLPHRGVYRVA